MGLQSKSAFAELSLEIFTRLQIVWFSVFDQSFSVYFERDQFVLDDDFLGVPFVVLGGRFQYILYAVQATSTLWIPFVRVVHLALEALLRPAIGLKCGMEIDAGIAVRRRLDVGLEVEILERRLVADEEEMTSIALANNAAVLNRPALWAFVDLPTVQTLAVEQLNKVGCWSGKGS